MNLNMFKLAFVSLSISFFGMDFILNLVNVAVDKAMLVPVKIVVGFVLMIGIYKLAKMILNKYGYENEAV